MSLTKAQHEAIQRIYDQKQLSYQRKKDELKNLLYKEHPSLLELENNIIEKRMALAKAQILEVEEPSTPQAKIDLEKAKDNYSKYLTTYGIDLTEYEAHYECNQCQDSGFINQKPCNCYKKEVINLLYHDSKLEEAMKTENFKTFSLDFYSKETIDSASQKSSYHLAKEALEHLANLSKNFNKKEVNKNVLLYGSPGVGKTFLSHAFAKDIMNQGFSCLYYSAFSLFDLLGQYHFKSSENVINIYPYLLECDMLIIDDLGTEVANQFTLAQLFVLMNERYLLGKGTLISTNLDFIQLNKDYGERIFSRLSGQYHLLKLTGNDIRLQKKIQQSR